MTNGHQNPSHLLNDAEIKLSTNQSPNFNMPFKLNSTLECNNFKKWLTFLQIQLSKTGDWDITEQKVKKSTTSLFTILSNVDDIIFEQLTDDARKLDDAVKAFDFLKSKFGGQSNVRKLQNLQTIINFTYSRGNEEMEIRELINSLQNYRIANGGLNNIDIYELGSMLAALRLGQEYDK